MRLHFSGLTIAVVVLSAIACGDAEEESAAPAPAAIDAGTPAPVTDAGAVVEPEPPPAPKLLKAGLAIVQGATNGYVVAAGALGLEVISSEDGKSVLLPGYGGAMDRLVISGGAVAWWTDVKDGYGVLNVWNAIDGVRTAVSSSSFVSDGPSNLFIATADGRRIAYWAGDAAANTADLHILDFATGASSSAGGAFSPRTGIDVWGCDMIGRFFGKKLIVSYCDLSGAQRVYAVDGNSVAGLRIDPDFRDASDRLRGWNADDTGNHVYLQQVVQARGFLLDITKLDEVVSTTVRAEEGFLTKDGAALVYRAGTEARRLEGGKDTRLASPVQRIVQLSSDSARALVFDGAAMRMMDTKVAAPARFITSQSTSVPELTASGNHVLLPEYLGDPPSLTVSAKSASGGTTRGLVTGVLLARLAPEGDGLFTFGKLDLTPAPGTFPSGELQHFDLATGDTINLGSGLFPGGFVGKKLLFTKVNEPGIGIYVFDPKK